MNMKQILTNIVHKVPILNYPKPDTPETQKENRYLINMELSRMGSKKITGQLYNPYPFRRKA